MILLYINVTIKGHYIQTEQRMSRTFILYMYLFGYKMGLAAKTGGPLIQGQWHCILVY